MISVIVPCFNESSNIRELYERLRKTLQTLDCGHEIIFVDDGSTDDSLSKLSSVCKADPAVKVIELSRNFGHQAAICAGLDHAAGNAVIMLDADLQHPPEIIPGMVEKWREGYEVVYTVRTDSPSTSFYKKTTAKLFYKLINTLGNIQLPENGADFRLLDKKVVKEMTGLKERTKFMRGLTKWVGFKQCGIPYAAPERYSGSSKYSYRKMIGFALDGIVSFSAFPLHLITFLGFAVSLGSFLYAVYALYIKLFTAEALPGWASILVAVLFLGGVQLISLGVIGEYLNRVYIEAKARPVYIIRSITGN